MADDGAALGHLMRQARRRRRLTALRHATLAGWLLVLALVVALGPSGRGPAGAVRAQAHVDAEQAVVGDDRPAAADDGPAAPDDAPATDDDAAVVGDGPAAHGPADAAPADEAVADDGPASANAAADDDVADDDVADDDPDRPLPDDVRAEPDSPDNSPATSPVTSPAADPGARAATGATRRARPARDCSIEQGAASFGPDHRLVMTYYYYWYDQESLDDPALMQRPPADPPIDWRSVEWHERQLADMASAGIDVALAVYWGTGPEWSVAGLEQMVTARERLLAAGLRPPAIGLFFDTNLYATLLPDRPELADLSSQEGLAVLADEVGGFFDAVPACHRARIDGRALVFFWRADTEDGDHFTFDDETFASLNDAIGQRYGERLHYALEQSWLVAAQEAGVELGAADLYRWGAALNGPRYLGRTVAIGPGYDDRRIEGRPGYTRDRGDGATYSRDLRLAVMSGTSWLLLETWNELWEGTAIAETEDSGRMYLGITARYAALFHQLAGEPARDGWFDLGGSEGVYLRRLADAPVEMGTPSYHSWWGARPFTEDDDGTGYFHFAVDPRLGGDAPRPLTVLVEYFDEGWGSFALEYDSLDPDAPADGAYTPTATVSFQDSGTWRIARFELTDASFQRRQYDGSGDFRIHDRPGPDGLLHTFGRVRVTDEPGVRPLIFGPESLTFVDPSTTQAVTLRWTDLGPVGEYRVQILPFDDDPASAPGLTAYGFTLDERRRCIGATAFTLDLVPELSPDQPAFVRAPDVTCTLGLTPAVREGVYRWRVQALSASGTPLGEPSDWAYLIVAPR